MVRQYAGRGNAAYHPAMLLGLPVDGYATGRHASRKIERACHDSVAFRFIAANPQPDHDSFATFQRRFLPQIEALLMQWANCRSMVGDDLIEQIEQIDLVDGGRWTCWIPEG